MKKKNILLIMADQLTPYMTGTYGNKEVITPNLDKLAEEGILFNEAYSSCPLCTPARASLMTGKYVASLDCYDNASVFSSEEPTFAHYLNNLGYDTVLSGKMHFVGPDQLHGFAKRLTTDIYPSGFSWLPNYIDKEKHILQSNQWGNAILYNKETSGPKEWNKGIQYDEETHIKAREYLHMKALDKDQPFCLCVSYHHPHDPFNPPQKYWDMYEDTKITIPDIESTSLDGDTILDHWLNTGFHRTDVFNIKGEENLYKVRRSYSALVTYIDDKVGQLLKDLKETGLDEDTIVIFTSDHGDMLGERGMVQKRCFYEWSAKVPLIVRLSDGTYRGTNVNTPVSLVDLTPTLLDLAGTNSIVETDGKSLLKIMKEGREPIFSESHGEGVLWPCYMVRENNFKYTYIYQKESQLFDVENDPKEQYNLAGKTEYKELEHRLKQLILDKFSPEKVLEYIEKSIPKKKIIRESMIKTKTNWDYTPIVDESKRFSR